VTFSNPLLLRSATTRSVPERSSLRVHPSLILPSKRNPSSRTLAGSTSNPLSRRTLCTSSLC
jgi:hypothetical protein